MKTIIAAAIFCLVLSGCNLYSQQAAALQNQEEVLEPPTRVSVLVASVTPQEAEEPVLPSPTHTAQPPPQVSQQQAVSNQPCSPRTDWPTYAVAAGDTLYGIAQKTGSTIDELADANCIQDASLLSIGQSLFVPRLPQAEPTQEIRAIIPTIPAASNVVGGIVISSNRGSYQDRLVVMDGETIRFIWVNYPTEITQAEFAYYPSNSPGNGYSIGIDSDLTDGVSAEWQVPAGSIGRVSAGGRFGQQGSFAEAHASVVAWSTIPDDEKAPPHTGSVSISPSIGYENEALLFENNALLKVRLEDPPFNCTSVEFIYQTTFAERENHTVHLGSVGCSAINGPVIDWHLPGGVEGYVYGIVSMIGVGETLETPHVNVYAEIYQ